jgi:hypothetical protein
MPNIAAAASKQQREPRRALSDNQTLAAAFLYVIQLLLILALVVAANRQQLLTKEEASSAFVAPTFLSLRLQHHVYLTNFYGYVFYFWASHPVQTLFSCRFVKAAIMAFVTPLVYLYLRRRFFIEGQRAFAASIAIGMVPGLLCFSWLGLEIGLETLLGLLALWLALFESPWLVIASCLAVSLAAGSYGSGFAFFPAVIVHHLPRLRNPKLRGAVIAGAALAAAVMLFPVFWWTNIQSLWIGGGGHPRTDGAVGRIADLFREIFVHGDSYYFFGGGAPALGIVVGLAAVLGLAVMSFRQPARCWPLFAVSVCTVGMYGLAGNVPGVRRTLPLVIALAIFAVLLLNSVAGRGSRWRAIAFYVPLAVAIAFETGRYNGIRTGLATSRIPLPRDFEFRIPPGSSMAAEIASLASGSVKLPADLQGYEPDRTLCILYRLTLPNPIVSTGEIISRCDRHGWSIPSGSSRFSRLRKRQ